MSPRRCLAGIFVPSLISLGWGGAVPAAHADVWLSRAEIQALPMSGAAWDALKKRADQPAGTPDLKDPDETCDVNTLAKALVYARTGTESYRTEVRQSCMAAIGTEVGGATLGLSRNLCAYVISADLVGLEADEDSRFRDWLRIALTEVLTDGRTLRSMQEQRPNNYGTHAGASRAAVAVYLQDATELARTAAVFQGWLGDRSSYVGFKYGDLSWQCDGSSPVGIDPSACVKNGVLLDGALPEEMRRGGSFQWPPLKGDAVSYTWEAVQGAIVEAEILHRQGYDSWNWQNQALRRMVEFLYNLDQQFGGWWATGDDRWSPWLVNHAYGTTFPTETPTTPGKNMGWTDWTHTSSAAGPDNSAPSAIRDLGTDSNR